MDNEFGKPSPMFPGSIGLDNQRPVYPEDHKEFYYAESLCYEQGMISHEYGSKPEDNPYKYKPYREAWLDGFSDAKSLKALKEVSNNEWIHRF